MEKQIQDLDGISPRRRRFDTLFISTIEALVRTLVHHWLALVNLAVFLVVFFSGLAPYLMSIGWSVPANVLYFFYKLICHEIPGRHYFIFGYRMTLDHRSLAIYIAFLGTGLLFALVRGRMKPLNWRFYILLCIPIAIDGFTQLLGFRESNWTLRTITGGLFGLGTAWLILPYMEIAMRDAGGET